MKKSIIFVLVALMSIGAFAQTFEYEGLYYNKLSDSSAEVVANPDGSYSGDIVIPSTVTYDGESLNVVAIGKRAFEYDDITSVKMGSKVTTVGVQAFGSCGGLVEVYMPNVETIGTEAFRYCYHLEKVDMPKVVTIRNYAFDGAVIKSLSLPATLDSIGFSPFEGSRFEKIKIDGSNKKFMVKDNILYTKDGSTLILYPTASATKKLTLDNSVKTIAESAFYMCDTLVEVYMPNVEFIGDNAFYGCDALVLVDMPNVKNIKGFAFGSCDILESVYMPKVESINEGVFDYCRNLRFMRLNNVPPRLSQASHPDLQSFVGVSLGDVEIEVPCGASELYRSSSKEEWKNVGKYTESPYRVKVESNDEVAGEVRVTSEPTCENPVATIEALPRAGKFVEWSDGNRENPRVVSLEGATEDIRLTAIFSNDIFLYEGIYYKKISNGSAEVVANPDGTKYSGEVTIPSTCRYEGNSVNVVAVGDYAFCEATGLTSVKMKTKVKTIGKKAFYGCKNLASVDMVNVETIGDSAFYNCDALTEMYLISVKTIKEEAFESCDNLSLVQAFSVKSVGNRAFYSCDKLKTIDFPDVQSIGDYAFSNCDSLEVTDMFKVKSIGRYAFYDCYKLTNINLPQVETIGEYAFYSCYQLSVVTLGYTIKEIAGGVFSSCSRLRAVKIEADTPPAIRDIYGGYTQNVTIFVPKGTVEAYRNSCPGYDYSDDELAVVDDYCYRLDESSKEAKLLTMLNKQERNLSIPSTVEYDSQTFDVATIEPYAFCYSGVEKVSMPSVKSIGDSAFYYCESLVEVDMPKVETIRKEAFSYCDALAEVDMPNVESIGYGAFGYTKINSLSLPATLDSIGDYAFLGAPLMAIKVDENNEKFMSKDNILYTKDESTLIQYPIASTTKTLTLGNAVKTIMPNAFCYCDALTEIYMPNVESIGDYAFYYCDALASVNMPNVVTIGEEAFYYCDALAAADMPNVMTIGEDAFCYCYALASVNMPKVDTIGVYAFYECYKLAEVNMPNVVTIGEEAFYSCDALASVDMPNVESIGDYAFYSCDALAAADMPNVVTIGEGAFYYCDALVEVNMPNVMTIGEDAFYDCEALASVDMPNVMTIGEDAFCYCYALASVNMPKVDTIGDYVFYYCESLRLMRVMNMVPPMLGEEAFVGVPSECVVQVPCGASGLYSRVDGWKDFENYEESAYRVEVESKDEKMGLVDVSDVPTCENPVATIEALPRAGYEFVKWSDDSTENPRTVSVADATEDIVLTAIFQVAGTSVESIGIEGATVYGEDGVLRVEGAEGEYQVYTITGTLVYSGADVAVELPRGVYVVRCGGAAVKVAL